MLSRRHVALIDVLAAPPASKCFDNPRCFSTMLIKRTVKLGARPVVSEPSALPDMIAELAAKAIIKAALGPVSARRREFRQERVWRGQRLGRHFSRHWPISGDRDHAIPRLQRQSHARRDRDSAAREPEHLLLTRPCDRCIEEAGDTDSAWPRAAMPSIVAVPVPISDSHCRSRDELDPGIGADRTGYVGLSLCREDKEALIPVVPPASGTAAPLRRRREKTRPAIGPRFPPASPSLPARRR
jgi:hypothetical protein